jgi:hypothetical protein
MTLKGSTFHIGRSKPYVHFTNLILILNFQNKVQFIALFSMIYLLYLSVPTSGSTDAWKIAKQCDMTTDIEN